MNVVLACTSSRTAGYRPFHATTEETASVFAGAGTSGPGAADGDPKRRRNERTARSVRVLVQDRGVPNSTLYVCAQPGNRPGKGGTSRKQKLPAAAICVPPPPSRECLTPFLLLLPRPESRCAHARRRSRFVGGGGDAPSGKSSSGDAGGLIRRRLPGLSTSRPLGRGSLVTTLLGIRTA